MIRICSAWVYFSLPLLCLKLTIPYSFFLLKYINKVSIFQDAGLLENNPLLWALLKVLIIFLLVKKPDFIISLGTSKPGLKNYQVSIDDCHSIQKNKIFPRICDLILKKMYNKMVKQAYKTIRLVVQILNKIHRLSIDFNAIKLRLNNIRSILELKSKVEIDYSLLARIDTITRYIIVSLFYFELDFLLKKYNRKYIVTRYILCLITRSNLAFKALLSKLVNNSTRFLINN